MRRFALVAAVLLCVVGLCVAGNVSAETKAKPAASAQKSGTVLKTTKEKVSYAFGMAFARNMKQQGIDLDPDVFMRAYKDTVTNAKPAMSDEEAQKAVMEFQTKMMAKQQEEMKKLGEKNKKAGDEYLAQNKKKEGVQTLASGLQYKVLKEGDGKCPVDEDTVKVNYKGSLIDGTVFDSSEKHGGSADFPVSGVIPGWTEAMKLMKTGSKWQIVIPANLAYGEAGAGNGIIPPNSTLVFEVELVGIVEPEAKAAPKAEGAAGPGEQKQDEKAPAKAETDKPAADKPADKDSK